MKNVKLFGLVMLCAASMAFVSCGSLMGGSSTTADSAAKSSGRSTANALISLYNSYQRTGTVSLSNPTDLTAALSLASGYTNMRANKDNTTYRNDFAAGMVAAGSSLITASNVNTVINTMNNLTGLNVNASNISNSVSTVTAIIQLMQILGQ